MFTIEELKKLQSLALHALLLDAIATTLCLWRTTPPDRLPTDQQEKEILKMEHYVMTIAKILIERGALPKNWEKK